jgi:hypothetical protein
MGAIFPMAPLATRMGFVKKRQKEARRSAQQVQRDCVPFSDQGAHRLPAFLDKPAPLIPTLADQDRCAQSRSPMDMTRQG